MTYQTFKPLNPKLSPFIEYYNSFKGDLINQKKFISLPEGKIGMVFLLSGCSKGYNHTSKTYKNVSHISGLIQEATMYQLSANIETFSIVFKPGAIYNFIPKHPIDQLAKNSVDLSNIFGDLIQQIEDRLHESNNHLTRIAIVEKFLVDHLQKQDERITTAIKIVERNSSRISVSQLSEKLNLGERQLRNIFKNKIGLSPKQFIKLYRFKNAMKNREFFMNNNAQFATHLGYYDESHFIHEFKLFSGMTPCKYFKNKNFISDFSNFNRLMIK